MKKALCAVLAIALLVPCLYIPAGAVELPEGEFHTEEMYEYILRSDEDLNAVFDYADGQHEHSIPDPIVLEFWHDGIPDSEWYVLQKSATPDFAECETITDVPIKEYEYYNAMLGEHFYWRAGVDTETIADSPVHEMTVTSLAPRVIYIPGGTNVRDVGGYESSLVPGAKIRQGLYYRGAELNNMKADGLAVLYDDLGVRAEIDLRDADRGRPYIKGFERIAYYNAPISYGDYFDGHADAYKTVYEVIANAAEAPVYLHCQAGADRTGVSTFMLLTACGVSFHDVALDYMFTNFSVMGERVLATPQSYWERLNNYPGETKAEQAKSWIMSKGVSEYTVEKIRETFVEGYHSEYLDNLRGDVNGDRKLNAKDVTAIMKALVGTPPDGYREALADVNADGKVNAKDVVALMKEIVAGGEPDALTAEKGVRTRSRLNLR